MSLFDLLTQHRFGRWAPIPLRLIVGFGFMEHGFAKLSKGPGAFAAILSAIGVPSPHLMAWLTILIEIGGGLAVIVGLFVSLVALPMAAVLLVAVFYGAPTLRVQLNQTNRGECSGVSVRTPGLRMWSFIPSLSRGSHYGWSRSNWIGIQFLRSELRSSSQSHFVKCPKAVDQCEADRQKQNTRRA
jgi:uncharacterized membrane protein YphA (DoxX/SURF4 family)